LSSTSTTQIATIGYVNSFLNQYFIGQKYSYDAAYNTNSGTGDEISTISINPSPSISLSQGNTYLIQSYISMSCTTAVDVSSVSNYINDSEGNTLTVSKTPDNGVYSSYYSYLSTIYTPETNVTIALNTSVVSTADFNSGYFKIAAGSVTLIVLATAN
jgi:hypothetical protein